MKNKNVLLDEKCRTQGELIMWLVYEHAKSKKPIQRLWVSSSPCNSTTKWI